MLFSLIERILVSPGIRGRAMPAPMEPGQVGVPGSGIT